MRNRKSLLDRGQAEKVLLPVSWGQSSSRGSVFINYLDDDRFQCSLKSMLAYCKLLTLPLNVAAFEDRHTCIFGVLCLMISYQSKLVKQMHDERCWIWFGLAISTVSVKMLSALQRSFTAGNIKRSTFQSVDFNSEDTPDQAFCYLGR